MIKVRQKVGPFPGYVDKTRTIFIPRPVPEEEEVMDIGSATAHEIGHAVLRHKPGAGGREKIRREIEAFIWAVSRRGLTSADKEYLYDMILTEAEDEGLSEGDVADLLEEATKKISRLK